MAKLNWGMIGGGEGSQIGPAHRLGAVIDGHYDFVAGALDFVPEKGRAFAAQLGIAGDRAYGDWKEMLAGEKDRPAGERLDLVTIATPNSTHFEIAEAFLQEGFNLLIEKPMTMAVEEGERLFALEKEKGCRVAVNYGYSGYAMVRHMRAMVARGDLGKVRVVVAEFAHGHHSDAADADNPRIRWRYDPAQAGVSSIVADCGIHCLHMASFVAGQNIEKLSADFASTISSRELEDDALIAFRMDGGTVGRCWTSAVALGRQHGLRLQVFGETGGMAWEQEHPNQIKWTPLGGNTEILERGQAGLSPEADRASRVTQGHAEGMPLAFANLYSDLSELIRADAEGRTPDAAADLVPDAEAGLRSVALVHAAVKSAADDGVWTNCVPPSLA
ncbi:Gfo/Idh/MocA family protein [Ahrensia sp. R2A130]|uniref:Gfo/Idh/MocA family protein n=1 Tax=Ahrensia sp. R2A130 TaxID=744979 RepID=UPI0001E0ACBB|nr:Gfo/Idh/MocA family oxidoreductase [Ahrensia sp. R2A130]EFL88682.1 oxidoreductase domain-containing protein [Ahrensia sp. R2A130]